MLRARYVLLSSIAVVLALPLAPFGAAVMDVPAAVADLAGSKADCGPAFDPATFLTSPPYLAALAAYETEPGFVDLLFISDGTPRLVALFDAAQRSTPLPAAVADVAGLPVQVVADTFAPLIAAPSVETPEIGKSGGVPEGCSGAIRPGARVSTPVGGCSANFVFTDQLGRWYVGTAGHCFSALGQTANIGSLGTVGSVVYRINGGVGNDFALIQIDPAFYDEVDPSMCHWGGPTAAATSGGGQVRHYGFPVVWGQTQFTRPRAGIGASLGADSFTFQGAVASGDSGSGARLENGLGLGVITHVNMGLVVFAHSAPYAFGTRVTHAMSLAEAATGLDLTLATAPVSPFP